MLEMLQLWKITTKNGTLPNLTSQTSEAISCFHLVLFEQLAIGLHLLLVIIFNGSS